MKETSILLSTDKSLRKCMWIILFLNGIDWLTYYGISQSFKNFMEDRLGYSKVRASAIRSTWTSFTDIIPLFGAYVGDEYLGRYKTIKYFTYWYIGGGILLSISAYPSMIKFSPYLSNILFLFAAFCGIGLGNGCFDPNIITFGGDQFNPTEIIEKELFFSHFYLTINIGSSISYGYLSYLSINGMGIWIPSEYGYFATFLFCSILLFFVMLLFTFHSSSFIQLPPQNHACTQLLLTIWNGIKTCRELKGIFIGFISFLFSFLFNFLSILLIPGTFYAILCTWIGGFLVLLGIICLIWYTWDIKCIEKELPILIRSDLIQIIQLLPIACFHIVWQCVQDQMDANFQSIAQQCDLRLGNERNSNQIPGAMLGLFDTLGVLIMIPLLDYIIYPIGKKIKKKSITIIEKMTIGFFLSAFTMLYTGIVEIWRRESGIIVLNDGNGPVLDQGTHKPMNNISWYYIAISYLLVSCCECMINITAYEIFYTFVPIQWKSTSQAIRSFMLSMGDNLASIITILFSSFIFDDLNHGNLEFMFFFLFFISFLNGIGFLFISKNIFILTG